MFLDLELASKFFTVFLTSFNDNHFDIGDAESRSGKSLMTEITNSVTIIRNSLSVFFVANKNQQHRPGHLKSSLLSSQYKDIIIC